MQLVKNFVKVMVSPFSLILHYEKNGKVPSDLKGGLLWQQPDGTSYSADNIAWVGLSLL